jgi:hypothetical protein
MLGHSIAVPRRADRSGLVPDMGCADSDRARGIIWAMSDHPQLLSEAAKIAALEILALLQRAGDDDTIATQIATKVQAAIEHVDDTHVGLLRHVARILTPAAMNAEGSGAAIVQAVAALRDAGISDEP